MIRNLQTLGGLASQRSKRGVKEALRDTPPPPCADCTFVPQCSVIGKERACKAFWHYVLLEPYKDSPRIPSRKTYLRIYAQSKETAL